MSIYDEYLKHITTNTLQLDTAQLDAIVALDQLLISLNTAHSTPSTITSKLKRQFFKNKISIAQGLYFYGPVGRGKTMLMDMFYHSLKNVRKRRIHFHHFMELVHNQLSDLNQQSDPLVLIAKQWANDIDILCFDEFFVSDIADAMLLSGLFASLLSEGIVLVVTSNCQPDELYRNGLQREKFLPTIALIKKHCRVVEINGEKDHRLKPKNNAVRFYYSPLLTGNVDLANHYLLATGTDEYQPGSLTLHGREIRYLSQHENSIFFDFSVLCTSPRSQRDYMALATTFSTVYISNVPQFTGDIIPAVFSGVEDGYQRPGVVMGNLNVRDDEARRFIALVDEFYERHVHVIISAQVSIDDLYQGEQLAFEFARCRSRLHEMQSW